jgi:spore coat polysaccharide biosynthesis predicted glycosyltransferase SpsG
MSSEDVEKVIQEVIDIFINAEIQNLPSYKEIEEEFEIIDKVYITRELIERVEIELVTYLDRKWPECNHYEAYIHTIWTKRPHMDPDQSH